MSNYSFAFERFWKLYPRKKVKHAAWLVWKKKIKPLFEQEVIDALQAQIDAGMFSDDEDFIPHGRTWLHQQRWKDEIKKSSTSVEQTVVVSKKSNSVMSNYADRFASAYKVRFGGDDGDNT